MSSPSTSSDPNGATCLRNMQCVIVCMVWLSVCVHLMNQNLDPAHGEDVLTALPIQPTRLQMSWQMGMVKDLTPIGKEHLGNSREAEGVGLTGDTD